MNPIVFGSLALAMTGYVFRSYFENQEPTTRAYPFNNPYYPYDEPNVNLLDSLNAIKTDLEATLFRQTAKAADSIGGISSYGTADNYPPSESSLEDFPTARLIIEEFCTILTNAKESQYRLLRTLMPSLVTYDDIAQMNQQVREDVLRLIQIDTLMRDACRVPITFDGLFVSPMAQDVFSRLSRQIF